MVKRGRKKMTAKKPPLQPRPGSGAPTHSNEEPQFEESQCAFNDREVERHIIAIQAIKNAEIENMLSRSRLLRSYITNEQLQTPAIQFLKENCPNLSAEQNRKYPFFELQWKDEIGLPMNAGDEGEMPASVGNFVMPSSVDLNFSARSVKKNILNAASLHIPGFALAEPSEMQFVGVVDSFQTPGITGQRLSFGMTPKTQRQPKHGEMLLSAHGSPLGVYNDKNLEAINESEDGSNDSIS